MYATRGETLHPNTTLNMSTNPPDYTSDGLEAEIDMSSKCLRVTCLSIFVMVSLFLAIVAVVLVLLLWFGVYTPNTNCTVSSGTSGEAVTGGISTSTPTPTPCVCPCKYFKNDSVCVLKVQGCYELMQLEPIL